MIRELPLPDARKILEENLPKNEFSSIYFADCEQMSLIEVGEIIGIEESGVKKLRQAGYKKLAKIVLR